MKKYVPKSRVQSFNSSNSDNKRKQKKEKSSSSFNNDNVIGESPSFSTSKLNKQISFYNDHYLTKSFDIDSVRYATNEHVDGKNSGSGDAKTSRQTNPWSTLIKDTTLTKKEVPKTHYTDNKKMEAARQQQKKTGALSAGHHINVSMGENSKLDSSGSEKFSYIPPLNQNYAQMDPQNKLQYEMYVSQQYQLMMQQHRDIQKKQIE